MTHRVQFGSIIHATHKNEDLIPAFAAELAYLDNAKAWSKLVSEAEALEDYESEKAGFILETLYEALNDFAPPYAYFGAHEGDGSDFGFWLSSELEYSFDGLKVSDTSEVPADYTGEALHVNDHGNMTLYAVNAGTMTEVWSVV
jgi:hypothetical protein